MARPRTYRAEAVVLKRVDFGEADRVLVVFTRDRGKLSIVAKGIRRISSRKAGHLELFTHADIQLARGANLDVVTEAATIDPFRGLRDDLARTSHAYFVAELADALTEEEAEQPEVFELLVGTFAALAEGTDPRLATDHYQILLLDAVGFRPSLTRCLNCRDELVPGKNSFSPILGGALCPRCGPNEPSARPISTDVLKVLRYLQRSRPPGSVRLRMPDVVARDVGRTLRELSERHIERRLRSPDLIARLRVELGKPDPSVATSQHAITSPPTTPGRDEQEPESDRRAADGSTHGEAVNRLPPLVVEAVAVASEPDVGSSNSASEAPTPAGSPL